LASITGLVNQVIECLTTQHGTATTITTETIAEQQMQEYLTNMANSTQQNRNNSVNRKKTCTLTGSSKQSTVQKSVETEMNL
jgi:hypothetical protein